MYKDTKNFVRSSTIRLSRKNAFKIPPGLHHPAEQSQEPGETCHIDIFGPLKTTPKGNSYVFSMIDAFTKYIHIVPLPDIKSSTISKAFFDNYIVNRGCPHKLVVDNATYFKGSEFLEFCRVMGIQKRHISNYSAHVNGRVEKKNQSLANILASITQNTNNWDEQLPHTIEIGIRVGRNQTTVIRICNHWTQEGTTDRRGRSHPPQCTSSCEERQIARIAVTDRSVTSRTVARHIES
ncbi:integrase catalytic domain-containing protein [Trichonephila clavipes]|uniref:Integrase catalytic domain-containing protein n=1 Tax=Trichonephila clavipes TaxID=2585209 RepID=A0A8X6WKI1_TRICX|nr:integrase catalytic domain-containing protein [Trichonephila clavipes]